MKLTGAQAVVECLKREGVEVIFGIPGGATIPLYDVLYDAPLRHILCRHEQGAAHAADGYARASGKVGVCCATSGPGATNLVTGIANAYMDSVPIVALTGQVPTWAIGRDAFQEADTFGITMPIVKHSYLVQRAEDIPQTMHDAFYIARTGRPGPTLVDFPRDVFSGTLEFEYPTECSHEGYKPTTHGNKRAIARAAQEIAKAQRPLMYVGGGAISSNAQPLVVQLAEKLNCPVFTTLMGKGSFPETHELSLGMAGMHGTAYANYAIQECDLLIVIGARFDDRVTGRLDKFAPMASVVHIDVDPAEIGKNVPATCPIVGDCRLVLEELVKAVKPRPADHWNRRCLDWKNQYPLTYKEPEDGGIAAPYVIQKLYEVTRGEAIVVTDVGQNQMWSAQHYKVTWPRQFLSSGGLGPMGYSLPGSVGAQVAKPDSLVCCITGDGGFQMTVQELTTAVVQRLPIKVILLNNQYLGMVRQWQTMFYDNRLSAVDLEGNPDFVKLAEAYGAVGMRAESPDEVVPALQKAMQVTDRPCLVEFRVSRMANVMPMIPAGGSVDEMRLE